MGRPNLPTFMGGILFSFALVYLCAGSAAAEESILAFMERYEMALDHGDTVLLGDVYEDWSPKKESRLRRYFSSIVTEFNVEFQELVVDEIGPGMARIRFLRRDRFTDALTGRRVQKQIWLDKYLRRYDGHWRLSRSP